MIPLFRPPELTGKYLSQVLESRNLMAHPVVEKLREKVAEFARVPPERVALGSSATVCFRAILRTISMGECFDWQAYDIGPTWHLIQEAFFDEVPRNPDNPDAIIEVKTDLGGVSPAERGWKYYISFKIRDCCHSWLFRGDADFEFASFYPTKLVGAAEGGVVICKTARVAKHLQLVLNAGVPGMSKRPDLGKRLSYGVKGQMSAVQAALALEAVEDADLRIAVAARVWRLMRADIVGQRPELAARIRDVSSRPYLFQIEPPDGMSVPEMQEKLRERGVASGWNFPPARLVTVPCWGVDRVLCEDVHVVDTIVEIFKESER